MLGRIDMRTEPANVPSESVNWIAKRNSQPLDFLIVSARLWFVAREEAMRMFCCGPGELTVTPFSIDPIGEAQ